MVLCVKVGKGGIKQHTHKQISSNNSNCWSQNGDVIFKLKKVYILHLFFKKSWGWRRNAFILLVHLSAKLFLNSISYCFRTMLADKILWEDLNRFRNIYAELWALFEKAIHMEKKYVWSGNRDSKLIAVGCPIQLWIKCLLSLPAWLVWYPPLLRW